MAKFRITIEGETPRELRDSVREYLGLDKDAGPEPAKEQDDFLTEAAAQPGISTQPGAVNMMTTAGPAHVLPAPGSTPRVSGLGTPAPAAPSVPMPSAQPSASTPKPAAKNDFGLDSSGAPWDERIHSVSQAKNKDGTWRFKRGVEQGTVQMVQAERGAVSQAPMVPAAPAPVVPPLQSVAPVAPLNIPMPPPATSVPNAHSLKTFKDTLVPTLARLVQEGKLTQEYIGSLCSHFNVGMIFQVNEVQLEELYNQFVQYGLIVKVG